MLAAITFIIVAALGRSPANLLFFTRAFKEALLVQFFPHGILFPSFSPILLSREGQPLKHSSGAISMNSLLSPPACELSLYLTFLEPLTSVLLT